jgi:hypothetical protein
VEEEEEFPWRNEYLATTWDALDVHLDLLLFCPVNPRIVLACFAV